MMSHTWDMGAYDTKIWICPQTLLVATSNSNPSYLAKGAENKPMLQSCGPFFTTCKQSFIVNIDDATQTSIVTVKEPPYKR